MPVGSKLLSLLSSSLHLRHLAGLRLARYARHPVTAFSSAAISHGRPSCAFTCPNFVFRSRAANQFHAEATVKEESGEALTSLSGSNNSYPWPEWSKLLGLLVEKGYSDRCISSGEDDDSFLVDDDLPEEFLRSAKACLSFARDRPDILRLLTKKNIEAVVLSWSPFLFKNGENSSRRMKLFFNGEGSSELELEKAETVDVMRYLLSYAYGSLSSSDVNVSKSDELEKSVRKLVGELCNLSGTVWKSKSADASLMELPLGNEQFSRSSGQDTELRCIDSSYTKFVPPSFIPSESQSSRSYDSYNYNSSSMNTNHTSSLNTSRSNSDANSAESSTDSSQPPIHFGNACNSTDNGEYTGKPNQRSGNLWSNSTTSHDGSAPNSFTPHENSWSAQHPYGSSYNANSTPPSGNSSTNSSTALYVGPMTASSPSPPSPGNYWNNHHSPYHREGINSTPPSNSSLHNNTSSFYPTSSTSQPLSNSWSNHYNPTLPSSGASWSNDIAKNSSPAARDHWSGYNASYPGNTANSTPPSSNSWENYSIPADYRSNYNKRYDGFKENSTQPSGNTSFGASPAENSSQPLPYSWSNTGFSSQPLGSSTSNYNTSPKISAEPVQNPRNTNNSYAGSTQDTYRGYAENPTHPSSNSWNSHPTAYSGGPTSNPAQPFDRNSWNTASESLSGGFPRVNSQKNESNGYSGKSLEGSCVTEPDPLDMSEEAKAERWFRRAAQIKDISELSQIPDEDFPQIMPMRKGVNRFVVSKRKTPLERRLASQQYRRNLPVVSSEPGKEPTVGVGESTANDGSDSGL
ncbi:hypothetical protein KSP40_PGU020375 [Platanthera guangdongensis]|uniref:Uncharacterized protein n=1 Tax=Platanthera guangdongensis TaxID=2320717 RepID=A0ABR2N1U9_9ASPA